MPASFLLTLVAKKQLTYDVFELQYTFSSTRHDLDRSEKKITNDEGRMTNSEIGKILPGQFLLCDTSGDGTLKRAYSVSWAERNSIYFIVKRLENGGGGSKAICDQDIGHAMEVWGPMGTFVLQDTSNPKVFIGTGTGFAPLYHMIKEERKKKKEKRKEQEMTNYELRITNGKQKGGIFFLFGVRELQDVFYLEELEQWRGNEDFDYQICCSRETGKLPEKHMQGRVTDWIKNNKYQIINNKEEQFPLSLGRFLFQGSKKSYTRIHEPELPLGSPFWEWRTEGVGGVEKINQPQVEFYICGNPAMVAEVRKLLKDAGIADEMVFFEQY